MKTWKLVGIIGLGTLGNVACGSSDAQAPSTPAAESFGTAKIAITQAPPDVACISITATGATAQSTNFPVTPGQSTTLTMTGVPVGTVSFSGQAFNAPCSSLMGATPDYVSNTVTTNVTGSTPAIVNLTMTRNASAQVNVDFPNDATCGGNGAVCDLTAMPPTCCAGLGCSPNPMTMTGGICQPVATCGGAGSACDPTTMTQTCCPGLVCNGNASMTGGACQAPACGNPGTACKVPADCCSGLACVPDPTVMGALTCQAQAACGNTGAACKTNGDCCGGLNCAIDAMGIQSCQPNPTCVPQGAACATAADCCSGLACNATPMGSFCQ